LHDIKNSTSKTAIELDVRCSNKNDTR
jgi:hypothetical protein